MAGAFEEAFAAAGAAVGDIREKLVEEGFFGRSLSDGQSPTESASASPEIAPAQQESPEIISLMNEKTDTVISAPADPDIQPHGQDMDR
jgi:hypothetical protein